MTVGDRSPPIRSLLRTLDRVGSRVLDERIRASGENAGERLTLRGGPVISLPGHIRRTIIEALDEPERRPSRGLPELRQAIVTAHERETGAAIDAEREVLVTNGAMQALNIVCRALLDPGDRVLIPTPNFFLEGVVRLAGGEPIYVPCCEEEGWHWDLERIKAAIAQRTTPGVKIFFACNPTNPTGCLPRREELMALLDLAEARGFVVLADESYNRFVYDEARFTSILALRGFSDRLLLVRSLSKSHALSNWRVGYLVGSPKLIGACLTVLEWELLHCAYVPQRVATAALSGSQDWLGDLPVEYRRNRDAVYNAVQLSPWLSCRKPEAGPFLFLKTDRLEGDGQPSAEEQMLDCGIPTVAGKYFQAPGYVRLPFGGDDATIDRLCRILCGFTPAYGTSASGE